MFHAPAPPSLWSVILARKEFWLVIRKNTLDPIVIVIKSPKGIV
jgi:hypothetical protein